MRKSKSLSKIRAGKEVRMCCLGHVLPAFIRHAAANGFDCIWLDTEHRAMSDREVQMLLAYFHFFDIDCMLRAKTRSKIELYRYLEDGATGLMIPHVTTADEAADVVQSVKFPPIGNRGIDGAGFDCGFEIRQDAEYPEDANRETFLVVQIESPEAVANVEQIAAVEGVDGLFIGPGDLGLRLRHDTSGLTLESAQELVATAATNHGKAWGRPVFSDDDLKQLHERGAQLLANGGDFGFVMNGLQNCGAQFDTIIGKD